MSKTNYNWELVIIRVILFLLPFILFSFMLPTGVKETTSDIFVSGWGDWSRSGEKNGSFDIKYLTENLRYKLLFFFGEKLDLSLIALCFFYDGTQYSDVNISSFNSSMTINQKDTLFIPYKGKICYSLPPGIDHYDFLYKTSYEHHFKDFDPNLKSFPESGIQQKDLSNHEITKLEIKTLWLNVFLTFIVFLIAYWAIILLIINIILISIKGLELQKK